MDHYVQYKTAVNSFLRLLYRFCSPLTGRCRDQAFLHGQSFQCTLEMSSGLGRIRAQADQGSVVLISQRVGVFRERVELADELERRER